MQMFSEIVRIHSFHSCAVFLLLHTFLSIRYLRMNIQKKTLGP